MKITEDDLMQNSFVLTTNKNNEDRFHHIFKKNGFEIMPRPYYGRVVDRASYEYHINKHFIAAHGSHFEICEMAIKEDLPFVCVFEDDAIPCFDIHEKLQGMLENIPDDAFIVKMGYVPFNGFKYRGQTFDKLERIIDHKYSDTYLGGSHSYIIFKSFYEHNHEMYERFKELEHYKDIREIHNPMFFNSQQLQYIWLYEWLMTPNVYKNERLQQRIYSLNPNENYFTQPAYVTWNEETLKVFSGQLPNH